MRKEKPAEKRAPTEPVEEKVDWRPTQSEVEERMAADPDYTPNHDGRLWMLPG